MKRRDLSFKTYDEIIAEIKNLKQSGYEIGSNWNLGQICRHISYFMKGSLDGFEKEFPWILRVTIGKLLKKKLFSTPRSKPNGPTDPNAIFQKEEDDKEAIELALNLLERLKNQTEPLKPSSIFGELTNDEWNYLHKRHWAGHLSFLIPN